MPSSQSTDTVPDSDLDTDTDIDTDVDSETDPTESTDTDLNPNSDAEPLDTDIEITPDTGIDAAKTDNIPSEPAAPEADPTKSRLDKNLEMLGMSMADVFKEIDGLPKIPANGGYYSLTNDTIHGTRHLSLSLNDREGKRNKVWTLIEYSKLTKEKGDEIANDLTALLVQEGYYFLGETVLTPEDSYPTSEISNKDLFPTSDRPPSEQSTERPKEATTEVQGEKPTSKNEAYESYVDALLQEAENWGVPKGHVNDAFYREGKNIRLHTMIYWKAIYGNPTFKLESSSDEQNDQLVKDPNERFKESREK